HPRVELLGQRLLAERSDRQARDGDAELHRRDEPRRVAGDPQDELGLAVALVLELHDPRTARRDEAVFGRDEQRVQEDQAREGQHLEEERHVRRSGARVLGGRSSSTRISGPSIAVCWTERTYVLSSAS